MKDEGRGMKEEGRGKREEGRRKKEEGRRKREEGRGKREEGRGMQEADRFGHWPLQRPGCSESKSSALQGAKPVQELNKFRRE
jgi:hypothetical protein